MADELAVVNDEPGEVEEASQENDDVCSLEDHAGLEDQSASFQLPKFRRSYGGVIRNGKFQRSKIQCVEDFSEEDRRAIIFDLVEDMARRKMVAEEKLQMQRNRQRRKEVKKKQIAEELEKKREAEACEHTKERQVSMTEWLTKKAMEERDRKARDVDLVNQLRLQEEQKKAVAAKKEEERVRERDRRLRWAASQRAKLELQVAASHQYQVPRLDPLVHAQTGEENDETQLHDPRSDQYYRAPGPVAASLIDSGPVAAPLIHSHPDELVRARPSSAMSCVRPSHPASKRPASAAACLTSKRGGDAQDARRQSGLVSYAEKLEQAKSSYAVSSRPCSALRQRPGMACPAQLQRSGSVQFEAETRQSYYRSPGEQAPARRPTSAPSLARLNPTQTQELTSAASLARLNPAQTQELTSAAPTSKPTCPHTPSMHPSSQGRTCQHAPSSSNPFSRPRDLELYLRRSKSASSSRFKVDFASKHVVVKTTNARLLQMAF